MKNLIIILLSFLATSIYSQDNLSIKTTRIVESKICGQETAIFQEPVTYEFRLQREWLKIYRSEKPYSDLNNEIIDLEDYTRSLRDSVLIFHGEGALEHYTTYYFDMKRSKVVAIEQWGDCVRVTAFN